MSLPLTVRKSGKEYRVVGRLDIGDLDKAGSGTWRWKFFLEATRLGKRERIVRAWRGITVEDTKNVLEAWYRREGYQISLKGTEFIDGSYKD